MNKLFRKIFYFLLPFIFYNASAQNLLSTDSWQLGEGSVQGAQGYLANGSASENWRIMGLTHLNEEVMLWEARNDAASNQDGGWDSYVVPILSSETYRFVVWIKKSSSTDGTTYFGVGSTPDTILDLNGYPNRDPFFFTGDLPELDKWYLVVSYVFKARQRSSSVEITPEVLSTSGIFDSDTGKKVGGVEYFRFSLDANYVNHKVYLNFDENTSDRQYMYGPRIELVDGREPSIEILLGVNPDSQLNFFYDLTGNQKARVYCPNGVCQRSSRSSNTEENQEAILAKETEADEKKALNIPVEIVVSPNPAKDILHITLTPDSDVQFEDSMSIHSLSGALLKTRSISRAINKVEWSINDLSSGAYLLHMHTTDGLSQTKKIIKL